MVWKDGQSNETGCKKIKEGEDNVTKTEVFLNVEPLKIKPVWYGSYYLVYLWLLF